MKIVLRRRRRALPIWGRRVHTRVGTRSTQARHACWRQRARAPQQLAGMRAYRLAEGSKPIIDSSQRRRRFIMHIVYIPSSQPHDLGGVPSSLNTARSPTLSSSRLRLWAVTVTRRALCSMLSAARARVAGLCSCWRLSLSLCPAVVWREHVCENPSALDAPTGPYVGIETANGEGGPARENLSCGEQNP